MVLIDCGVSHNFISTKVADKMQLLVIETSSYSVEVRDGHKVHYSGVCKADQLDLNGVEVQQDVYPFGLGGAEVVLGLEQLARLKDVVLCVLLEPIRTC